MTAAKDFWARVDGCKHEPTPDYSAHVHCGHESLGCAGGLEWHCKHCGVYITEDPCDATSGMSGWPYRRWKGQQKIWSGTVRWGALTAGKRE